MGEFARSAGFAGGAPDQSPGAGVSGLLAVDVAVLLPDALLQPLLRLNATLLPPPDGFRFDDTHLPHVTLAQQFIAAERLPDVVRETAAVLRGAGPLRLLPAGMSRGRTASTVRLVPTGPLTRLHADLMDRLQPFESGPGDEAAFFSNADEAARAADVEWVRQFRTQAAYGRFDPHVTLGVGPLTQLDPLRGADATRAALCRLGRFCTCRGVLAEWSLTDQGT